MEMTVADLSIGDKIYLGKYVVEEEMAEPIIFQIVGIDHYKDDLNPNIQDHVTLLTDRIIDVRGFDATEPSNENSSRRSSGNNRYRYSNLRQWLNKTGHPWYENMHPADAPPTDSGMSTSTGYDTKQGFLSYFSGIERSVILSTNIRVVIPQVDRDEDSSEVITDKVFTLSNTEVGLTNESGVAEGSKLSVFTGNIDRIAYPTQQAVNNSNYSSEAFASDKPRFWWLRTPVAAGASGVRSVDTGGTLSYIDAYRGYLGVRPALNLKSDILISEEPDLNGVYSLIFETSPHIITLDKPITIPAGQKLWQVKFDVKQAEIAMKLVQVDSEKYIYQAEDLDTDTADIEIEGTNVVLDKLAYVIS